MLNLGIHLIQKIVSMKQDMFAQFSSHDEVIIHIQKEAIEI